MTSKNISIVSVPVLLEVVASLIAGLRQVERLSSAVSSTSPPKISQVSSFPSAICFLAAPLPILHLEEITSAFAIGAIVNAGVPASPTDGILTAIQGKCVLKDEEKEKT